MMDQVKVRLTLSKRLISTPSSSSLSMKGTSPDSERVCSGLHFACVTKVQDTISGSASTIQPLILFEFLLHI